MTNGVESVRDRLCDARVACEQTNNEQSGERQPWRRDDKFQRKRNADQQNQDEQERSHAVGENITEGDSDSNTENRRQASLPFDFTVTRLLAIGCAK